MSEPIEDSGSARIRTLLKDQIERVWGRGETALVDSNYSADVRDHMPVPGQPTGRDALKDVVEEFRAGIPDLRMDLHATLVAGDMGVDVWTLTGTHGGELLGQPATGQPISVSGIDMIRVQDGHVSHLWHVEEMALLMSQITQAPVEFGAPVQQLESSSSTDQINAANADRMAHNPGEFAIVPGEAAFSQLEQRNLLIARRHIEEIWAKGRSELCWEMYHPEVVDHNRAPDQKPGIEGIIDVLQWLREAVPDLSMTIECYVIDADLIADRWVMTGTHTGAPLMGLEARGKSFTINGMDVARVNADGLITEIWHAEEFHQLLQQVR
ncbi:MAG: ester cyclase family protein [Erythrobacter sp.]